MLIVDTKNAPGAIGPYSQAYETNGLVITSGQLPVNPADGTMPEGIAAQAESVSYTHLGVGVGKMVGAGAVG